MKGDDWQLEMLCNLAAAEFAMPTGSMPSITEEYLDIEGILALRKEFQVSAEAMLLRLVKLTTHQCSFFAASRVSLPDSPSPTYAIDFTKPSRAWSEATLPPSTQLPENSVVTDCTAIGFTARGQEEWSDLGKVRVECVGVSPYPSQIFPRVIGLIRPSRQSSRSITTIDYLRGDATQPRGTGNRFLVQIINDAAINWGGGFSLVVRKKWPAVHDAFHEWAVNRENLKLGNLHVVMAEKNITVLSMIAQHGYGRSTHPRIRYLALRDCLTKVGELALKNQATVHMPRIGCGEAGGSWDVVNELVTDALCAKGIKVFVYDLPGADKPLQQQATLRFDDSGTTEGDLGGE
jgi:O-acetyl-ADP-ribose deacetylase (regulator of RNase III)